MSKFKLPIIGVYRDLVNYFDWINVISNEKRKAESKYNKFSFSHNYFYVIYTIVTLPEEDRVLPDSIKKLRVVESLREVNKYLDEDLGFAEYLVPEFNQFYDENNNPTLNYGIVYRFAFKTLSLKWFITRMVFVVGLVWAINKFNIIGYLKNLI